MAKGHSKEQGWANAHVRHGRCRGRLAAQADPQGVRARVARCSRRAGGHAGMGEAHPCQGLHRLRRAATPPEREGTIQRITERVSPACSGRRAAGTQRAREVADVHPAVRLPVPAGGEVVIFDRSWYNRAGVERVMGFCTPKSPTSSSSRSPTSRRPWWSRGSSCSSTGSGSVERRHPPPREPHQRPLEDLEALRMDLKGYSRWYDYSRARDAMFARPTPRGPRVGRQHRRQTTGPAQHHQPPAEPHPLRATPRSTRSSCPNGNIRAATPHPTCRFARIPTPF